jgi:hypothetical protein
VVTEFLHYLNKFSRSRIILYFGIVSCYKTPFYVHSSLGGRQSRSQLHVIYHFLFMYSHSLYSRNSKNLLAIRVTIGQIFKQIYTTGVVDETQIIFLNKDMQKNILIFLLPVCGRTEPNCHKSVVLVCLCRMLGSTRCRN